MLFSTGCSWSGIPPLSLRGLLEEFEFVVHYQAKGQSSSSNYNVDPVEGLVVFVSCNKWRLAHSDLDQYSASFQWERLLSPLERVYWIIGA